MYTFVPNESFGQLLNISPKYFIKKKFDSDLLNVVVWFADQNSKPLEIEDKINITLVINQSITYKSDTHSVKPRENICKRLWIFNFCERYGQKYW